MLILLAATAHATAWVLHADDPRRVERAARLVERTTDMLPEPMDRYAQCVVLEEPPVRLERRVARRLGRPVEERRDCDVAWFPLGRGWIGMLIEPPATALDELLDAAALPYVEVRRPSDATLPIRMCVAQAALRHPMALADHLSSEGVSVRAVYEVGGCSRRM